ncbi:NAD-dependent epimerase/dehydratase family protein [Candidatus Pacearchaeota archaeon]|nr:NAD-dependent epimerase/dehydratase family protein [Candidatus Pacearchaeota archaeon]
MNYLITGGSGFIGSRLAVRLLEHGHDVTIIDPLPPKRIRKMTSRSFKTFPGTISENRGVFNNHVDGVVHLAATVSVPYCEENPEETFENNVHETERVFKSCVDAGIERVVLASSAAVYGNAIPPLDEVSEPVPRAHYGYHKYLGEKIAQSYHAMSGLETIGLRFFNVFGPGQDPSGQYAGVISAFIGSVLEGKNPTIFGNGHQTRDFVYVDDVADAIITSLETGGTHAFGQSFNIGSGQKQSIKDVAKKIISLQEKSLSPIYKPARLGDIEDSCASIAKAAQTLGWRSKTSFDEGLKRTYEWFLENK